MENKTTRRRAALLIASFAATPLRDAQSLLAPQPLDLLVVHHPLLGAGRVLDQLGADFLVLRVGRDAVLGDLVHLVDIETGAVVKDVVVGTRPRRFAATPDNKELWVTAELSGEVWIIDRDRFEAKGKIEFLPPGMRKSDVTPVGITMTKDGKTAYVTLGHAAHVAVVDVPLRSTQSYILVGKRSWGITLSRDEKMLYVANGFGDDITIIDAASRKPVISVPVGRVPWGVVIDD